MIENMDLTKEEIKSISEKLKKVIDTNSKCLSCRLKHPEFCFFAYECINNDFCHYTQV